MAGKLQHEIPRLFQRGFLIPDTGSAERIWVYRREKIYPDNIGSAGAQGYFYSRPDPATNDTLDDKITDYEGQRLQHLIMQLRALSPGVEVPGDVAAEAITHLTIRNAHLRGTFTRAYTLMTENAAQLFSDENFLRQSVGLHQGGVGGTFREKIINELSEKLPLSQLGIPMSVLERVLFALLRENFTKIFAEHLPSLDIFLTGLTKQAGNIAADGHRRVLSKTMAPDVRVDMLSSFNWSVIPTDEDLILPDCVALGIDTTGATHPLMLLGLEDTQSVYLPLTSQSLLVGTRGMAVDLLSPAAFNTHAAACSHNYFLSASRSVKLDALAVSIGTRSVAIVEQSVLGSVHDLMQDAGATARSDYDTLAERPLVNGIHAPFKFTPTVSVSYYGDFDADTMTGITNALSNIIGGAAWTVPLERLDGITIDDHYPETLSTLDRGIPGVGPPASTQNELGMGIAQAPTVMRSGVLKSHIVVHGCIARRLLSDDGDERQHAIYVFLHQLADVGVLQVFDECLPGILLNQKLEGLERDLHRCSYPAWNAYFSHRATGSFYEGQLQIQKEVLFTALKAAKEQIISARTDYQANGDLETLIQIAYGRVAYVLEHAAGLLGVVDSCGCKPLEDDDELSSEFQQQGLTDWLSDFHFDLASLWDRRGKWSGYEEFMALNRHAERLLWPYGILPWTTPDGIYRVEVSSSMDLISTANFNNAQ